MSAATKNDVGPAPEQEQQAGPTREQVEAFGSAAERANLQRVATLHAALVLAALTLWGAADLWAVQSGWGIAWFVALANAILGGFVISNTLHEWGHYAGARLAGAVAPVREKPFNYFFIFDFPFERNDRDQFVWMSLGGIIAPWVVVLLAAALVPIDNVSRATLLAVFVTRAMQVSLFEVPIVQRTRWGGEPKEELMRQLKGGFATSRYLGLALGALVWILV